MLKPPLQVYRCGTLAFMPHCIFLSPAAEEEGEEEDGYDLTDKFLADEAEDGDKAGGSGEEGEGSEEGAKKRRKKRRREALQLEEEDYDLLEENQVTVRAGRSLSEKRRQ